MAHTTSFLDLPFEARVRIYENLGLIRSCPISLIPEFPYRPRKSPEPWTNEKCWYVTRNPALGYHGGWTRGRRCCDCLCLRLPTELLYVSKAVHRDVVQILFSKNKFVLRGRTPSDLSPLCSLSSNALAAMTSLLICLNSWPCPRGHTEDPTSSECWTCAEPFPQSIPLLSSKDEASQFLIQQWRLVCDYLASAISPNQLNLTFICDVADLETGEEVIEPLMRLPALKRCTIRLGTEIKHDLRRLAQTTSQTLTRDFIPKSGFPFAQLPRELRLQILSLTHLTPLGDYHPDYRSLTISNCKLYRTWRTFPDSQAKCCYKCTHTFGDCCCITNYSAYSAACVCREVPTALFLVDKQMYQDAIEVLYTNMSFNFEQHGQQDSTAIIAFFQTIPKAALSMIRSFRIDPSWSLFYEWEEEGDRKKWEELVRFIKQNLEVSRLSIIVDTESKWESCRDEYMIHDDELEATRRCYFYYECCRQIKEILRELDGIHDIYFKMGWFSALGPIWEKEIMGENYVDRHDHKQIKLWYRYDYEIPPWHASGILDFEPIWPRIQPYQPPSPIIEDGLPGWQLPADTGDW